MAFRAQRCDCIVLARPVRLARGLPRLTIYDTPIVRYPASYHYLTSEFFFAHCDGFRDGGGAEPELRSPSHLT